MGDNALAALAYGAYRGNKLENMLKALYTYAFLPHRLESLGVIDGVEYINDSKATNVASVLYAINGLGPKLYLLVGGQAKGQDFSPWFPYLQDKVQKMYVFGEGAEKITKDLKFCNKLVKVKDLKEAVTLASQQAQIGSKILLSPGCSSFDEYKNYEHRGMHFKQLYFNLQGHP